MFVHRSNPVKLLLVHLPHDKWYHSWHPSSTQSSCHLWTFWNTIYLLNEMSQPSFINLLRRNHAENLFPYICIIPSTKAVAKTMANNFSSFRLTSAWSGATPFFPWVRKGLSSFELERKAPPSPLVLGICSVGYCSIMWGEVSTISSSFATKSSART